MSPISQSYWENFTEMVVAFAFLALLIERALYQVFDSRAWKKIEEMLNKQGGGEYMDLKPWISVAVSIAVVLQFRLDMVATIFNRTDSACISMVLTGLFLSGGSTGVYKFFKRARELKEAMAEKQVADAKSGTGDTK